MQKNSFLKLCHTRCSNTILSYMKDKVDFEKMGGKRTDQEIKSTSFGLYIMAGSFFVLMGGMFLVGTPFFLKFFLGCLSFIFYILGVIHEEIFRRRFENAPSVTPFKPQIFSEHVEVNDNTTFKSQTFSEYTENGKILTKRRNRIIDWILIGIFGLIWALSKINPKFMQKILEKCLLVITPFLPTNIQYEYEIFISEILNNPEYGFYIFFFVVIVMAFIGCCISLIYNATKKIKNDKS